MKNLETKDMILFILVKVCRLHVLDKSVCFDCFPLRVGMYYITMFEVV